MIALCVDDEYLLLEGLKRAVEASPDITFVKAIDDPFEAEEWAMEHPFDIAFLDVRMPVMSGIELAGQLLQIRPGAAVIFCTGYREYALDAFQVHATGFLLKPIRADKVQQEIDHVKALKAGDGARAGGDVDAGKTDAADDTLLTVRTYGGFDVRDFKGQPVSFRRNKEKELFAALIHQGGREVSTDCLCNMLWDDNAWMYEKNRQYIYTLFSYLRRTLREAGAGELMTRGETGYSLDMSRIRIDETGKGQLEYLPGYAWSSQKALENK